MNTLLLDQSAWDLVLDTSGNIALAGDPYSMGQDAASAIRTWSGEVYYNTVLGMPYQQNILGKFPPAQLIKVAAQREALTVPGVASAQVFLTLSETRQLGGQVQITSITGEQSAVPASSLPVLPPDTTWFGEYDFTQTRQSAWFISA